MDYQYSPYNSNSEIDAVRQLLKADRRYRGSVDWFFWISALSVINTVAYFLGWDGSFVVGLGVTQLIDVIASDTAKGMTSGSEIILIVGFILDLFFTGIFVVCGILGRKVHRWAIIAGMVLYAIDGIFLFWIKVYFGGIFHIVALFGISRSLVMFKDVMKNLRLSRQPSGQPSGFTNSDFQPPM